MFLEGCPSKGDTAVGVWAGYLLEGFAFLSCSELQHPWCMAAGTAAFLCAIMVFRKPRLYRIWKRNDYRSLSFGLRLTKNNFHLDPRSPYI